MYATLLLVISSDSDGLELPMKRMTDRHGNTVEVAVVDGQQEFIARGAGGFLLGRVLGDGARLTTPAQLAAAGIDLGSLR